MPASNADKVEFKNFNARSYAPVVIYFDFEPLIILIQSCDDNPSSKSAQFLPLNHWTITSNGNEIFVFEKKYAQAAKVFATFGYRTLRDYHNLYLKTDTLLLACAVEEFRKLWYDTYGMDSAQYFTSSHLLADAFIKISRADLHLVTERPTNT